MAGATSAKRSLSRSPALVPLGRYIYAIGMAGGVGGLGRTLN
jgi:hypothetical protein